MKQQQRCGSAVAESAALASLGSSGRRDLKADGLIRASGILLGSLAGSAMLPASLRVSVRVLGASLPDSELLSKIGNWTPDTLVQSARSMGLKRM